MDQEILLTLTADIVAAHVTNNTVSVGDMPALVQRVHEALVGLGRVETEPPQAKVPIVSIRASIKPDFIVCMECGARQKTLKRHLQTAHGMTPEQYRKDYGLPRDYPLVAPNYSKARGEMARAIGLGQKGRKAKAAAPEASKPKAKPKRARRKTSKGADVAAEEYATPSPE
jgi:predicted transcriptional regulator